MTVVQPQPSRGAALLLVHCAAVEDGRESALERLERSIGRELTRLLMFALAAPQGRRGSSSP